MLSDAKNHHFVSQSEQRLSAIDPTVSKKNQRIYSYTILDRERFATVLDSVNGVEIQENMSFNDLFSIDVIDSTWRYNLEDAFSKFEKDISTLTNALLAKAKTINTDLKSEVIKIFVLKLINTFRNPFCIERTHNTVGNLIKHKPTDIKILNLFEKIDSGTNSNIQTLAKEFSVTEIQYKQWMKALFLLLIPEVIPGFSLVELITKNIFERSGQIINVFVSIYTGSDADKNALISDRGCTVVDSDQRNFTIEFNLSANAFICYSFNSIEGAIQGLDQEKMKAILAFSDSRPVSVTVKFFENNLPLLAGYNGRVIHQSFRNVYSKNNWIYIG